MGQSGWSSTKMAGRGSPNGIRDGVGRASMGGAGRDRVSKERAGQVSKPDPRYSQSLGHGLAMLASFSAEHFTQGIADMADALSMGGSTTHRYATTLAQLGYLEQNRSRRYSLTSRSADFGLAVLGSMSLHEISRGPLHELRRHTGWTVSLAILDGTKAMLVNRLRGWRGLHEIDLRLGSSARLPLHCTAMGKVLLAHLPRLELRDLLVALTLTREGPNCITGKRVLRSELEQVHMQGFAIDDEELTEGLRSIAVPVLEAGGGALAALDLAVPAWTFAGDELSLEFHSMLSQTAERIAAALTE